MGLIRNTSNGGESKGPIMNPDSSSLDIKASTVLGSEIADCRFLQIRLVVGKLSRPGSKPSLNPESRY